MVSEPPQEETTEQLVDQSEIVGYEDAPIFYANGVSCTFQVFGAQIVFTLKNSPKDPAKPLATVHMSLELAKVLGRILRSNIKQTEKVLGTQIPVPEKVLDAIGIRDLEE